MEEQRVVYLKDCLKKLKKGEFTLPIILGKDTKGKIVIKDLTDIGSMLVVGKVGSGKTVFTDTTLYTLLNEKKPEDLKLVLIDSFGSTSDLYLYEEAPHLCHPLVAPIFTSMEQKLEPILWCLKELERRASRNIDEPKIVIFITEFNYCFSDDRDFEDDIYQLAKNGPKVGIHVIILSRYGNEFSPKIKKSFNGRAVFSIQTEDTSMALLNQKGAEDLLGQGDMLYKDKTLKNAIRLQAPYVSYEEKVAMRNKVSRKKCLCSQPDCGKCLLINCRDDKCKIHTKKRKKLFRKQKFYPKIKKLIESGTYMTPEIMKKEFHMGYLKGMDFINEFWDDEIETYPYVYNRIAELESTGTTISTSILQKEFSMHFLHAFKLLKKYKGEKQ